VLALQAAANGGAEEQQRRSGVRAALARSGRCAGGAGTTRAWRRGGAGVAQARRGRGAGVA